MTLAYWPGLGGGPRSLAELEPTFAAAGIETLAVDPRYAERRDWNLDALAADVAATGADVYAGSSWGGAVAARAVLQRAPRALVLIDGGHIDPSDFPGFGSPATREDRVADMRRQYEQDLRWSTVDAYLEWSRANSRRWNATIESVERASVEERDGEIRLAYGLHALEAIVGAYEDYDAIATLRAVPTETRVLVVAAQGVPEIDEKRRQVAERVRELAPQADVRYVDSGHDVVADMGPGLAEIVVEWLAA